MNWNVFFAVFAALAGVILYYTLAFKFSGWVGDRTSDTVGFLLWLTLASVLPAATVFGVIIE